MSAKAILATVLFLGAILVIPVFAAEQADLKPIQLPAPQKDGGRPLMQVLNDRHSTRDFDSRMLTDQMLSDLLWAAFGVNRPDAGKRTAPSAMNWQEIDIYVALAGGLYLYDAKANQLKPVLSGDIRAKAGTQPFVKDAPVNLIYVADYAKAKGTDAEKDFLCAADAGFVAENAYLYCASAGLATVIRASIDRPVLAKIMKLRSDQKIMLAQTVGYPKK